ncbi:MAG: dephospho-CoA kinase [Christensenellales bacterium]|jgi:dephospho-CoA kinase
MTAGETRAMKIIGLTGGIAMGKSTAADFLRSLGALVIDADEISRNLTAKGGKALAAIRNQFGPEFFSGEELDRSKLATQIFASEKAREKLNAIVHPLVYDQIQNKIDEARLAGEKAIILDIPLLFETGYHKSCDEVWLIATEPEIQLERLMKRSGLDREQAQKRISAQMPLVEKMALLRENDKKIDNNGDVEHIYQIIRELWVKQGEKEE